VAFAAVKWLLRYIQTHRFTVFAWYRIAAGLLLLIVAADRRPASPAVNRSPRASLSAVPVPSNGDSHVCNPDS